MIEKIENKIMEIMKHYGFGDSESAIMAILSTNEELTAREIAEKTGYAYSTVINSLNFLNRIGLIKKGKRNRLCIYSANLDFVKIIDEDRKRLSSLLQSLKEDIKNVEDAYRERLSHLISTIENAIRYLKKAEVC